MTAFTSSTSTSAGLADGDCWFAKPTKKAALPTLAPVEVADAPVRVLVTATAATAVSTHEHAASASTLRADAIAADLGLCKENPVIQTSFLAQALAVNSPLVLFAAFAHFLPFEQACVSIKLVFDYAVANNLTDVANIAYSILPRSDATEEEADESDKFWDFVRAHGVVAVLGPIEQIELADEEKNVPLAVQDIMRFIRTEGPIQFQHTPAPAPAAVAEPIPDDVQTARSAFTDAAFVAEMDAALEDDWARLIAGDEDEEEEPMWQPRVVVQPAVHTTEPARHSVTVRASLDIGCAAGFEVVVEEAAGSIKTVASFSRSPKSLSTRTTPSTCDLARPSLKSVTSSSSVMANSVSLESLDSFPECAGALAFMDFTSPASPAPSSFATSGSDLSSSISNSDSVSALATSVSNSPLSSTFSDLPALSSSASSDPSSILVGSASSPSVAVYNKTKKTEKKSTSAKGTANWVSRVTSKARAAITFKRKPIGAHQEEWVAPTGGFEWESMDDPFARA